MEKKLQDTVESKLVKKWLLLFVNNMKNYVKGKEIFFFTFFLLMT